MSDSPYIIDVTAENFAVYVVQNSHQLPVLVDFWADWCGPCKMLMPLLAKLVEEYQGKFILTKVNTEEQQALAQQYGIRSIPAVKLFRNGEVVDEFAGALPEGDIRAFLDRHIPRESDNLVTQANAMIQQGDVEGAIKLIEDAKASDPTNTRVILAYAKLKATLGEIEEAEAALNTLPAEEQENPEVTGLRARFQFDSVVGQAPYDETLVHALANGTATSEQIYQLAAHRVMENDHEAALELLLKLMMKDRSYGDDTARKGMLSIFEMLGSNNEMVNRYRNRMFNALH
ncbi:thioredoxin [Solemya velesiana gill symbiont]|uniref:Thioredoxin n=1 Tax=Solemya velesiana gill symbiont TaxID=1918948 RepID=A0A1T2KSW8_9GAMM|nr:thioredoxin [Solemya velesiana gill symbiont]OOZ35816.1 thioredoxin [Solemya velesiana gill symbiont]